MFGNNDQGSPRLNDMTYRAPQRPANPPELIHLLVKGSRHVDFANFTLASPFMKRQVPNKVVVMVDGERMLAMTSNAVLAFLDHHLRGQSPRMQAVVDKWPELVLRQPALPEGWEAW